MQMTQLIDRMTTPTPAVREAVAMLDGDVLILGVGGKMGPTLAELLVRAGARRVIGVSRFGDPELRGYLDRIGVETLQADLLNADALKSLPNAKYIYFMAGFKFGASGNPSVTWAMNTYLPGMVVQRYETSHIVYVSSGNVYAFTPIGTGGADESGETAPAGEYAQSRLGGERIAEYFAGIRKTPLAIVRLFYATELRYGILHDLAWKVFREEPINLEMGYFNQIWQGDANAYLARFFPLCGCPPVVLNMTGPETLSVRTVAEAFGARFGKHPVFVGIEKDTALLGNTKALIDRLGPTEVSIERMIDWMTEWVLDGGPSLGKPTKFESRTGKF
ncbi:MAG: NAD(P)-dependent oxidoreductase [candidate division Zixibacteria bacterium]|nr:NAD(P)-dependent oxidoreductase [candidate division Zixibacteria bacterium]